MPFYFVGHRGAAALFPENTLASFAKAEELGCNQIELDLHLTKDGQIVVIHDAQVDRTTNGTGRINDLTLAQLKELDAGDGHTIPTFTEALDHTTVSLQVEIKDLTVLEPLADLLATRPQDLSRLEFSSFKPEAVAFTAARFPQVTSGYIHKVASQEVIDRALDLGARRVMIRFEHLTADFVQAAKSHGLRIDLWPVETVDLVRTVIEHDLDGFTTDDPQILGRAGYQLRDGALAPL